MSVLQLCVCVNAFLLAVVNNSREDDGMGVFAVGMLCTVSVPCLIWCSHLLENYGL